MSASTTAPTRRPAARQPQLAPKPGPPPPAAPSLEAGLETPIAAAWPRLSAKRREQLERIGVVTLRDLLFYLPRDYADRRRTSPTAAVEPGPNRTVRGYITRLNNPPGSRPPRQIATVYDTLEDLDNRRGGLPVTWYGQQYLNDLIQHGDQIALSGAVTENPHSGQRRMYQPDFHLPWRDEPNLSVGNIAPVYRLTQGLNQDAMRRLIHRALNQFSRLTERSRPGDLTHTMEHILWALHFPRQLDHPALALRELAADEVLELQMALLHRRAQLQQAQPEQALAVAPALAGELEARLPFHLTESQRHAVAEIRRDLSRAERPMHRLLQGEVGSGKTVVALHAIIDAVSAQAQAVLLAPTEILAEQHHRTVTDLLQGQNSPLGPGVMQSAFQSRERPVNYALLTARTRASIQKRIHQHLALGTLDFVIGTHSVINEDLQWRNLGLAIADEQHRFGTEQRAALRRQAHYLMLTATPIPRTLQLTLYRDLDVSSLEMPPETDRSATVTTLLESSRQPAHQAIEDALTTGHQAFVIAPFIDPNEAVDAASVAELHREITKRFPDQRVDQVHGQLRPAEIEKRMKAFRDGRTRILVATSIIEVGIDVPNATVMIIESAERFGMAQLHQLRGRIGRGEHPGHCFLAPTANVALNENALNRLRAVRDSTDGLELAQADLSARGEGQITGVQQSGPGRLLRTGNAYDLETLERQREIAEYIQDADPELAEPRHQPLKRARDRMLQRMDPLIHED